MEFGEKLQKLRKQKGLTQEALAEAIFVSRTAVSKWESGRGYPSIDSLKAIAAFFSVTIDELLTGEEVLTAAEEDNREKEARFCDLIFGLLDCSTAMLFFLPFFGLKTGDIIQGVSLLALNGSAPYLRIAYLIAVAAMIVSGILMLALQNWRRTGWMQFKRFISVVLNGAGMLLFTVSRQPYAATFLFVFLTIKVIMLMKKR